MNAYHQEQIEAIAMVQKHLKSNPFVRRDLFEEKRRQYTWPDQPVLFDKLEALFVEAGYRSSLMYLHNSPGLLRVKQKAGIIK